MLYRIFYSVCPCLRKYRKIPKNLVYKDLSNFYPDIKKGRVIKVYDGDSITVAARIPILKNDTIYKFSIRLNRIDCPEIRTQNVDEKKCGLRVRDLLSEKIMNNNVRSNLWLCQKALPMMAKIGEGSIIIISSIVN